MSASSSAAEAATQLRIHKGMAFADLPAAMQSKIVDIIGSFDTTELSSHPNLVDSFSTQIEKFEQAFKLILKAYPPTARKQSDDDIEVELTKLVVSAKEKLTAVAPLQQKLEAGNLDDNKKSIDDDFERTIFNEFQKILVVLNQGLMGLIDKNWEVETENKEAIEALNLAEQYITMSKGRRNLATLSRFKVPGKTDSDDEVYHVLQVDKPLNPCNDLFIQEVLAIINNEVKDVRWFQKLKEHEQVLILNHPHKNSLQSLQAKLLNMINQLKCLKQQEIKLGDSVFGEFDELSKQVIESILPEKESIKINDVITTLESSIRAMAENHRQLGNQSDKLKALPKWFLGMDYYEQRLFQYICKSEKIANGEDVKRVFRFLSSKHRTVPIPANFCEHQTYVFKNGEVFLETKKKIRSAHGVSRDVLKQEHDVQLRHARDNYNKMIEVQIAEKIKEYEQRFGHKPDTIPVLLQTLISPIKGSGGFIPDLDLDRMKKEVVDLLNGKEINGVKVEILSINHPFNMARIFMPTQTDDKVCNQLLTIAYYKFIEPQISMLAEEATNLQTKLAESLKQADDIRTKDELVHQINIASQLLTKKDSDLLLHKASKVKNKEGIKPVISETIELLSKGIGPKDIAEMFTKIKMGMESEDTRIKKIKTELKQFVPTYELASLCEEYRKTLASSVVSAVTDEIRKKGNRRELFLSSYEQLIMSRLGGVAYGSCVSGKDRKALEILHSDAMDIYFALYGEWPGYEDKGSVARSRFVEIFAQLYVTRHQQTHAGQNSPGCDAIKTPYNYLPEDICQAIKDTARYDLTWLSDMLATNNELKRIGIQLRRTASNLFGLLGTRSRLRKGESMLDKASWRVKSLTNDQVDNMLERIKSIISNTDFWSEKGTKYIFWAKTPRTVSIIEELFSSKLPPRKLLTKILEKLATPGSSMTRDEATGQFYDIGGSFVMGDSDYSIAMEALRAFQMYIYEEKPMAHASSSSSTELKEADFEMMPRM